MAVPLRSDPWSNSRWSERELEAIPAHCLRLEESALSDRLQALKLFVNVARVGSFSKGASAMKLSQPTASRIIAVLEEEIGAPLFTRSTRALTLREAGNDYLARVQPILDALEEAEDVVRCSGAPSRHRAGGRRFDHRISLDCSGRC